MKPRTTNPRRFTWVSKGSNRFYVTREDVSIDLNMCKAGGESADMIEILVASLLIAGALVGLVSSYFGVGACFIMVPVMINFFESLWGVSPNLAPLLAFGTNMAVVVPTALSGVLRHRVELRKKGVNFPFEHWLNFAVPVGVGSFLGSLLAYVFFISFRAEAGIILKTVFGFFCIFGAYRFMMSKPTSVDALKAPSVFKYAPAGLLSGMLAHFIGIGGGILYVPVLNTFLGVPVHLAAGISLATMTIGSSVGALSFGFLGYLDQLRHPLEYPPLSLGWFNLVVFLTMGTVSVVFAQIGPQLAHKTPPGKFKILLAIVYTYIGLRLIIDGFFQLLGLPPPIP